MRILIVDDEIKGGKCRKLLQFLRENHIKYDYVKTLDMAKLAIENGNYTRIVTDRDFPEKRGMEGTGKEGQKLVEFVEKNKKNTTVLVFSSMLGEIESPCVFATMRFWDEKLFQSFMN